MNAYLSSLRGDHAPRDHPLVDLRASYLAIREELLREWDEILDGMNLLLGPRTQTFERDFAAYCGTEHGLCVSSGTAALLAALEACGIGSGDEVICPSHTFFATVEAILHAGATPVLVDVEADTLTIDPAEIRGALSAHTRAIVPVHLYGHPADMDPILEIASEHGLRVIEDSAQAHGARYAGRRCGSLGDLGCFSFYFTKNLGAFGEGGFVTTDDAELAERLRLLRNHGHSSKFEHQLAGHNLRMDELQAAVLRLKLPLLEAGNARRREIARRYGTLLEGLPLQPTAVREGCEPVHHLYAVRVKPRDELRAHLEEQGIGTGIHYPIPAHLQPALQSRSYRRGSLKVTEEACRELLSLPIYPELQDEQVEAVADGVRGFFAELGQRSATP